MKKALFIITLFCCFLGSQNNFGQSLQELERSYRECIESGIPTAQTSLNCTYAYLLKYESMMVKTLYTLTDKLAEPLSEKLFENQAEWKRWMKSETDFYQFFYTKIYQGGTMVRSAVLSKKMELIKKRIIELQDRLNWLKE